MIGDSDSLELLKAKMSWLSQRQQQIATNVANAETPNYRARDLEPIDFRRVLDVARAGHSGNKGMTATHARHLVPASARDAPSVREAHPFEVSASGNAVVLEQEMVKIADTELQYQAVTNLYTRVLSLMKLSGKAVLG